MVLSECFRRMMLNLSLEGQSTLNENHDEHKILSELAASLDHASDSLPEDSVAGVEKEIPKESSVPVSHNRSTSYKAEDDTEI